MKNEKKVARYAVVGFYPQGKNWALICLSSEDKEYAKETLEKVKANPQQYGVNRNNINEVTEFALQPIYEEEEKAAWWNW